MNLPFGLQQSTLAGGISGVAVWGIGLALTAFGFNVPADVITAAVAIIIPLVVHIIPDAAKVDAAIKNIAAELPQTYAEYPGDKPLSTTISNINKG